MENGLIIEGKGLMKRLSFDNKLRLCVLLHPFCLHTTLLQRLHSFFYKNQ